MKAKPFIVIVFFMFLLLVFASGSFSQSDLTPHDPPAPAASTGLDTIAPLQAPVSGSSCYTPYLVQSGDTLSKIARACGVLLSDLVAANPGLANPNLIYPGQEIRIPSGVLPGQSQSPMAGLAATAAAQQAAAAPGWNPSAKPAGVLATGGEVPTVVAAAEVTTAPTTPPAAAEAPAQAPAAQPGDSAPTTSAPAEIPGIKPGETIPIDIKGVPANAEFELRQGTSSGRHYLIGGGVSDASGVLHLPVQIRAEARPGEVWYVYAKALVDGQEYKSDPIEIGGLPQ